MIGRTSQISIILTLLIGGCIRPAPIEEIGRDEILVVEGLITDEDKRQEIKLSITTPVVELDSINPVENATVYVIENEEVQIDFLEEEPGIYRTVENYTVAAGSTLQLFFTLANGDQYESTMVTMQSTPEIDSIYATFTPNPILNREGGDFQFFVATNPDEDDARAFRWTWRGAYTIQMENPSRWEWLGGNDVRIRELGGDNSELQVERCWINERSTNILVEEEPVEGLGIRDFQIYGFHSDTRALRREYGIEVRQYALSEESLVYWNLIADTNQGSGFLFDRQVGTVISNVNNINDPEELVLGIFEATEVKVAFRKFDQSEFIDDGYVRFSQFFVTCGDIQPLETTTDEIGEFMERNFPGWEIGFFITNGPVIYFPARCSNCTRYGENQPPDFWQ